MGIICTKTKTDSAFSEYSPSVPCSRFAHQQSLKRHKCYAPHPESLLSLALDAVVQAFDRLDPSSLHQLPPDIAQLLLNKLVEKERLDDGVVLRLQGQFFFELLLDAYPEPIKDFWVRFLASELLQTIDLSRTRITDGVLRSIPNLPRCRVLHLDYCPHLTLDGATMMMVFGRMPMLEELSIAGCESLGPKSMECVGGCCSHLRRLNLRACHKLSGLRPLVRLASKLEALDVGWCNALGDEDAAAIGHLRNLRELRICHTSMSGKGLKALESLSGLIYLSLGGIPARDGDMANLIKRLQNLKSLDLERCALIGKQTMQSIAEVGMPLEKLSVAYTNCDDQCLFQFISRLYTLQELCLESCDVSDDGIKALSSLKNLKNLDISDTDISNRGLIPISSLPKLTQLDLSFTAIDGKGIDRLSHCTMLKSLNLDCRDITDTSLHALQKLSSLENLSLFGTAVTDAGCSVLGKCTSLKRLEACSGGISDAGVAALSALTGLCHLSLAQNWRVTNSCIESLVKLNELTSLNLSHTQVSSSGIPTLANLQSLQVLGLSGTRVKPRVVSLVQQINPSLEVKGVK